MIFRNLVFSAVLVGIISGIVLALVQQVSVTPIILAAEGFEISEAPEVNSDGHTDSEHSHSADAWAPEDGSERLIYTTGANILASTGFALLLLAAMTYKGKVSLRSGVLWGVAGYLTFFVAPFMGLHPEIPGMEATNLQGCQGWWLITISLTALGLGLIAFAPVGLKVAGVFLLIIPHVLGAPLPEVHGFNHPDANVVVTLEVLAHNFLQATAIANAIFWLVLGLSSAYFINKFGILDSQQTSS